MVHRRAAALANPANLSKAAGFVNVRSTPFVQRRSFNAVRSMPSRSTPSVQCRSVNAVRSTSAMARLT
jgi:hypothetical protein